MQISAQLWVESRAAHVRDPAALHVEPDVEPRSTRLNLAIPDRDDAWGAEAHPPTIFGARRPLSDGPKLARSFALDSLPVTQTPAFKPLHAPAVRHGLSTERRTDRGHTRKVTSYTSAG